MTNSQKPSIALALAALNLTIGGIVSWLKLPIYLDSIGIILSTVLLGWQFGLLTGLVTVAVGFLLISPYLPAFSLTVCALVAVTEFRARHRGFRTLPSSVLSGLLLAVVAAIVSAPVTAFLFGGVTASGTDVLTALLRQTGKALFDAVLLSGISSELFDKIIVAVAAFAILKSFPARFFTDFGLRSPSDAFLPPRA